MLRELPELRVTNTAVALNRLQQAGIVGEELAERVRRVYRCLRRLIDALRVVRGNARDLARPVQNLVRLQGEKSDRKRFFRKGNTGAAAALDAASERQAGYAACFRRSIFGPDRQRLLFAE